MYLLNLFIRFFMKTISQWIQERALKSKYDFVLTWNCSSHISLGITVRMIQIWFWKWWCPFDITISPIRHPSECGFDLKPKQSVSSPLPTAQHFCLPRSRSEQNTVKARRYKCTVSECQRGTSFSFFPQIVRLVWKHRMQMQFWWFWVCCGRIQRTPGEPRPVFGFSESSAPLVSQISHQFILPS